jgi:cyclase
VPSVSRRITWFCLTTCIAAAAWAQTNPPATRSARVDFDKVEIRTTRLANDFFVLEGHGGAISVLTGPDGVLIVDSQFAQLTDKIVAAIKRISDQPVRFLVNTHVHVDHTGGNENFAKLGTLIFSRDELRTRLMHPPPGPEGRAPPSAPEKALPVVTYEGPVTLHVNGEDIRLVPIRAAHTDGDTLVHFPKHDVLAVGDYYRSIGFPYADIYNGGTLEGLLAGLSQTIDMAGPDTKIIPGHGPIVDRTAVIAHRDLIVATRDRMLPLIAKSMTLEQVLAANLTVGYNIEVPDRAHTAEQFVRWMYSELTK